MNIKILFIAFCILTTGYSFAAEKTIIRIGVQTYGTVDWELSAIENDPTASFELQIQHLVNAEAGKIALQGGSVDMIVADWLWVSNLRSRGNDFTFYPYSTTSGALIVPADSAIHSLADLKGKRLGIAGGELDKNWLLLQALGNQQQVNLQTEVEKTFAAPPLINEQLKQHRLDAALTYWHFAARLEAEGYRQLIDGKGILTGLGITDAIPALGYVFKQSWAEQHKSAVKSFLLASKQAKNRLCSSDMAWQKIVPLTKAEDKATETKLRQRYCEGSVKQWTDKEQQAIAHIYSLLANLSHQQLTGDSANLQPGTFWSIE